MHIEGSVVREGATVPEAVEKALRSLGINRDQAEIEVLDAGSSGFLGFRARKAKVRVSIKEEVLTELKLTDVLVDLNIKDDGHMVADEAAAALQEVETDSEHRLPAGESGPGTAKVRDGRLIVNNPVLSDEYASIAPGKHVRLTVNGRLVEEQALVREDDDIQIEIVHDEPAAVLELDVSSEGQEARLALFRHPGARYALKDVNEDTQITIEAEMLEIVEPSELSVQDVIKFLNERNVTKGIDEDGIRLVLENPNSKENYIVARGEMPVDGVDAYIVYPFLEAARDEEDEGYFGRDKLISVNPGDIVAIKVPREKGKDGWTVTGEPIMARVPVDVEIQIKNGCEFTDGGTKVTAAIAGRPVVETTSNRTFISIDPIYIVKEVSQLTGDIKFSGDVEVQGQVRDGCTIEANGNIQVFGDVSRATLRAGTSVILHKMVFDSSVIAGGRAAVYSAINPYLVEICEILRLMCTAARQRKASPGISPVSDDDGPLVQHLIDSRFPGLPRVVKRIAAKVEEMEHFVHEEVARLARQLKRNFTGLGPLRLNNITSLEELRTSAEDALGLIECTLRKSDAIKVRYVQNCSLLSSGDIIIEGQGCYISSLTAGGEVIISGRPGIARGVKVVADGNIFIRDIGSEFETQTHVRIKENGKITAEVIRPDVMVQIGNERFRVDQTSKNFEASLDFSEKMVITRQISEEKSELRQ